VHIEIRLMSDIPYRSPISIADIDIGSYLVTLAPIDDVVANICQALLTGVHRQQSATGCRYWRIASTLHRWRRSRPRRRRRRPRRRPRYGHHSSTFRLHLSTILGDALGAFRGLQRQTRISLSSEVDGFIMISQRLSCPKALHMVSSTNPKP